MTNNPKRYGRFTASEIFKLVPGERGGTATRDKYILEKAIEIVQGCELPGFTSRHTEHGNWHEREAIDAFMAASGLTVEYQSDQFLPYGDNAGATPDGLVTDPFTGEIFATVDVKCPTGKFWHQKLDIIQNAKPQFQNSPKEYFYQAQMQMLVASAYYGVPIKKHYLVRYLAEPDMGDYAEPIQFDMDDSLRIYWKVIEADEVAQVCLIELIEQAAIERDELVNILKQTIQ